MTSPRQIARRAFLQDLQRLLDGEIKPTSPIAPALVGFADERGIEVPTEIRQITDAAIQRLEEA